MFDMSRDVSGEGLRCASLFFWGGLHSHSHKQKNTLEISSSQVIVRAEVTVNIGTGITTPRCSLRCSNFSNSPIMFHLSSPTNCSATAQVHVSISSFLFSAYSQGHPLLNTPNYESLSYYALDIWTLQSMSLYPTISSPSFLVFESPVQSDAQGL